MRSQVIDCASPETAHKADFPRSTRVREQQNKKYKIDIHRCFFLRYILHVFFFDLSFRDRPVLFAHEVVDQHVEVRSKMAATGKRAPCGGLHRRDGQ